MNESFPLNAITKRAAFVFKYYQKFRPTGSFSHKIRNDERIFNKAFTQNLRKCVNLKVECSLFF